MRQVQGNPTVNYNLPTMTTYAFTSTGASGQINASGGVDMSALERGQSVFLEITNGSVSGYVTTTNAESKTTNAWKEYYVIPSSSSVIQVASTKANALIGTPDTTASGNAGAGTLYPTYKVGGVLYVGTGGTLSMRGVQAENQGFSKHTNIPNGSEIPYMIKDIIASGNTASDIVCWQA